MSDHTGDPLAAYKQEIHAVEDGWWEEARGTGRGLTTSRWASNLALLRQIDARHGISESDPHVYSIAAYRRELEEIDADWTRFSKERGWDALPTASGLPPGYWDANSRFHVRAEDCLARHFRGQDTHRESTIDTVPKLWLRASLAAEILPGIHRRFPADGRAAGAIEPDLLVVYRRLQALRLSWAPSPPFKDFTQDETVIELQRIVRLLEDEDAERCRRIMQEEPPRRRTKAPPPSVAMPAAASRSKGRADEGDRTAMFPPDPHPVYIVQPPDQPVPVRVTVSPATTSPRPPGDSVAAASVNGAAGSATAGDTAEREVEAANGQHPPEIQPATDDTRAILAAIGSETAVKIYAVAKDQKKTADQKLRAIYTLDNRVLGWDGRRWAELLGVSEQAIRKTDWWREDRNRLRGGD